MDEATQPQGGEGLTTPDEIYAALSDVLTEEDLDDMRGMDKEERAGYLFAILDGNGIDNPGAFLLERGIAVEVQDDADSAAEMHASGGHPAEIKKPAKDVSIIIFRRLEMFDELAKNTAINSAVAEDWRNTIAAGDDEMNMAVAYEAKQPIGRVNVLWTGAAEQEVVDEIGVVPMANALHLNEEYRGQGIGKRLMLACEYLVKNRPDMPQMLALGVEPDDLVARHLYEELGYQYRQVGGQDTYKTGWPEDTPEGQVEVTVDCMLMVKDIVKDSA